MLGLSLFILAVILVGFLYKQKTENPSQDISTSVKDLSAWAPAPGTEKDYLFSIKSDSPTEDRKKHFEYAVGISKESPYLNITGCNSDPLVFRVYEGDMVNFKNDGDVDISIGINPDYRYVVRAKSINSVKLDFGHGIGLYSYGCNDTAFGMILVEKK